MYPISKIVISFLLSSCVCLAGQYTMTACTAAAADHTAPHKEKIVDPIEVHIVPLDQFMETYPEDPPVITTHYTQDHPASRNPVLQWEKVKNAVSYDVEMSSDTMPDRTSPYIYVPGYDAPLPDTFHDDHFQWRVRAMNLDGQPISDYSPTETAYVDASLPSTPCPVPLSRFNTGNGTSLLYPVYNWIRVSGAASYEVEILNTPHVQADQAADDSQIIGRGHSKWFDWYDDSPRISTHPMYWRVRALDEKGQPMGVFCSPQEMDVNPNKPYHVGTLGDSITHGGGDLSYSPSDWEYSYQSYLPFDVINLGLSGDTSEDSAKRFDADVLPFHLDYLIIMTGTNSLRGWVTADSVIADLETIKEKCQQNNIKPVFMTLPPINPANIKRAFKEPTAENWQERFRKVNAWIRHQVHIDLAVKIPEDQELPTSLAIDGIHLNYAGKKLMADAIQQQWPGLPPEKEP